MRETWFWSLSWEDPLEEGMATHSSIPAWRIPMDRETWRGQSMGLHRARHDWGTEHWAHPRLTPTQARPGCADPSITTCRLYGAGILPYHQCLAHTECSKNTGEIPCYLEWGLAYAQRSPIGSGPESLLGLMDRRWDVRARRLVPSADWTFWLQLPAPAQESSLAIMFSFNLQAGPLSESRLPPGWMPHTWAPSQLGYITLQINGQALHECGFGVLLNF